jgi:hypothetical protein
MIGLIPYNASQPILPSLHDYPVFNPSIGPGRNQKDATTGRPAVSIVLECAANCDAVLFTAYTACPATFVNVLLVAFSISIHLTSIHPLYDR